MVGARGHRGRKSLSSHHVKKYVYGVFKCTCLKEAQSFPRKRASHRFPIPPRWRRARIGGLPVRREHRKRDFWITHFVTSTATHFLLPRKEIR
ncbi:hypothetical protein M5K25_024917, partial [Dendrobium thyrsiflorum]